MTEAGILFYHLTAIYSIISVLSVCLNVLTVIKDSLHSLIGWLNTRPRDPRAQLAGLWSFVEADVASTRA